MTPAGMAALHALAFPDERPWSETEFADLLASPHVFASGAPHAFALGRVIADEAELLTLATHPNHRRQGLARGCLAAFHAEARARGAATSFLEVAAPNEAARQLYLSQGYTEVSTRRNYYRLADGTRVDAVILRRTL